MPFNFYEKFTRNSVFSASKGNLYFKKNEIHLNGINSSALELPGSNSSFLLVMKKGTYLHIKCFHVEISLLTCMTQNFLISP